MTQKSKILLTFNTATLDIIKEDAEKMGVSVNAYFNFIIGQYVSTKATMLSDITTALTDKIKLQESVNYEDKD